MVADSVLQDKEIKHVVIPVDFSDASKNALRYLFKMFAAQTVDVTMLHITQHGQSLPSDPIVELENLKRVELGDRIKTHCKVVKGEPTGEILTVANEVNADLVVMGIKKHGVSKDLSIAETLLREINCPVIAVPEDYISYKLDTIAYASDYKEIQRTNNFDLLRRLALKYGSKVYIFHIFPDDKSSTEDLSEGVLEYYLESTDHDYVSKISTDLLKTLKDFIEKKRVDLISVLARDHGDNKLSSKGELIYRMVEDSSIPVLILN